MSDRQGTFDVGAQPSLFDDDDRALLAAIADQASEEDRAAMEELRTWIRP